MRTIGKHYNTRLRPPGDYPAVDDYTGAVYYRSEMERDSAGHLRRIRPRRERDRVELAMLQSEHAREIWHEVYEHDGNGAPFGGWDAPPSLAVSIGNTSGLPDWTNYEFSEEFE